MPYFPWEDGVPGRNGVKQSALVVTGNFSKDDRQVVVYTFFKKISGFL